MRKRPVEASPRERFAASIAVRGAGRVSVLICTFFLIQLGFVEERQAVDHRWGHLPVARRAAGCDHGASSPGGASGGVLSSVSDDDSGGSTARCASSHQRGPPRRNLGVSCAMIITTGRVGVDSSTLTLASTRQAVDTASGRLGRGRCHTFNPRDPRLLDRRRLSFLCLDTRYNVCRLDSARVSRGSRDTPTCGVASGTSMV
jgi:hypothetical protein